MSITHLKGLKLIPDPRNSGTALDVTGTIAMTATGDITQTGDITLTGILDVTGTITALGDCDITGDISGSKVTLVEPVMSSVANGACGLKTIAAGSAGVGVISSTRIVASSRIFLTPVAGTQVNPIFGVRAVGTGTASIYFRQFKVNTCATASGKVAWMVVNK